MQNNTQLRAHIQDVQTDKAQPCVSFINPKTLYNPSIFGYSHIAEISKFNRIIHISGQSGEDIQGRLSSDFEVQVQQTFENLKRALISVGFQFSDIAVLKVLMVDHNTYKHEIVIQHRRTILVRFLLSRMYAHSPLSCKT